MISLFDYDSKDALPSGMKTPERISTCYAFDIQKRKFLKRCKRVIIWGNLQNVPDDKLDFLAVENRVLFYNSGLDPEVKRNLILNSIYWYMKLGTRQAMEEMIDIVFGNANTSIEEWFTYSGEAFHFRIAVGTEVTQTSITEFLRYLNTIKNARSRFDMMIFQNGITVTFNQVSEYKKFYYTFCGDFECGTFPDTEIGFVPQEVEFELVGESDTMNEFYTEAGTTPDISVGASFNEVQIGLEGDSLDIPFYYPDDSETESGVYPDISTGFIDNESGVSLESESDDFNLYYNTDAEKEAASE